jgi:hypothetical protein
MKSRFCDLPPFPCRFDRPTHERLERFSQQTGMSKALLIRHGLLRALGEFERCKTISFNVEDGGQ